MGRPKAITKLAETPNEGKRNWLIYAPSGTGKTVLAGTAPRALFLTVEAAGTESAKALGSDADEWVCDTWKELEKALKWLQEEGYKEYDWVIIDSITEMEEICWNDLLESAKREYNAQLQDYGIADRKIKKLVDRFNRLPINVLYTAQMAHQELVDDDGDEFNKVLPKIGREKGGWPVANLICGKVTLIGLLTVSKDDDDNDFRRLYVHGGEKWTAKDRHDTFDRFIENPNISEMASAVDERQANAGTKAKPAKAKKKKNS